MKALTVKAYAELIGKSEKTVYKMIKNSTIDAFKIDGKYRVNVDKNLLKVIDRTQKALEEAKAVLHSIETEKHENEMLTKSARLKPVKKDAASKANTSAKALKKTVKKTVPRKIPSKKQ